MSLSQRHSTVRIAEVVLASALAFATSTATHAQQSAFRAADPTRVAGSTKSISVISATYGANVGPSLAGNATADVKAACDGKEVCQYQISVNRLGDPAYGTQKNFTVQWNCGGSETFSAYAPPEAGYGSLVTLTCGTQQQGAVAPPAPARARLLTRVPVIRICGANCSDTPWDQCLALNRNYCANAVWDKTAYDAYWDDGLRQRIAVERWQDGQVHLKVVEDPVHPAPSVDYTGHTAEDGSIVGVRREVWPGHWVKSSSGPGVREFDITITAVEKPVQESLPCDLEHLPSQADTKQIGDNFWYARLAGDLATASCWDRVGAEHGDLAGYEGYAYDLLFGAGAVRKDYSAALVWAQKAADGNSRFGAQIAAHIYREGPGVVRNPAKADLLDSQFSARLVAAERKYTAGLWTADQAIRCQDNWGLMLEMGFDCYRIVNADLDRLRYRPPYLGSCSELPASSRSSCEVDLRDRVERERVRADDAKRVFESEKQSVLSICEAYRGRTFRNGQLFDADLCHQAADVPWK